MSKFQQLLRAVLPLAVLLGAGWYGRHLVMTAPTPTKKPVEDRGMLVEAVRLQEGSHPVIVGAKGSVVPAYSVELAAEVTGRVVWKSRELTTGGQVKKGDLLLKIDPRDYRIALEQQSAAVARAKAEIELELGRGAVAEKEWDLFGDAEGQGNPDLALRKPQRRSAELGLTSAESSRESAKLRLGRTQIRAPFNAVVRQNFTEPGRLVSPGATLASLVQTDLFMVVVSLPVEDLSWLKIPGVSVPLMSEKAIERAKAAPDRTAAFAEITTPAMVRQKTSRGFIERRGVVTRVLGDLDPVGRMARLLVAVRDPMGLEPGSTQEGASRLPLLLGAYVSVDLLGETVDNVFEAPRLALRDGDRVFLAGADNRLEVREVEVVWRQQETVLVRGLAPGDRLITSVMPSAVPGMLLRVRGDDGAEGTAPAHAASQHTQRERHQTSDKAPATAVQ